MKKCEYCGQQEKPEIHFLITQKEYYSLTKEEKQEICNGNGAKGTHKAITMFLDNLWGFGFDYNEAGNRHDVGYEFGINISDKIIADIQFFINLFLLFIYNFLKTFFYVLLLPINLLRVFIYPIIVLCFGYKAFYKNKR